MRERVQRAYRAWAKTYDRESNPSTAGEERLVMRLLAPKKGEHILDAGCGTGRYSAPISRKGAFATGIDFSRNMLGVARKKAPNACFICADLTKLPLPDRTFDKAICNLVISHMKNPVPALREIHRVLKPRGMLVLSTLHPKINFQRYELQDFKFPLSSYNCSIFHSFEQLDSMLRKSHWNKEKTITIMTGNPVRHCFTKEHYRHARGKPLGVIFVVRK